MQEDAREAAYRDHLPTPNKKAKSVVTPSNDSPEEIEKKRAERRAKKLREIQEDNQPIDRNAKSDRLGFKKRHFVSLPGSQAAGRRFKVMTWNILAQALVKRDMFPGSDLLKWHLRGPVLMREAVFYSPDIACFQEVDRLSDHAPELKKHGYEMRWENGYADKLHGLLIAWKSAVFRKEGETMALIDDLAISSEPDLHDGQKGSRRTGLTRVTRNVGLCLALSFVDKPSQGVIVATHHLFWHARHIHERARQTGLWLREVRRFRRSREEWKSWPLIFTGDFNTQPFEPTYRLLVGKPLLPRHSQLLEHSRVIHFTVDNLRRDECMFPFGASKRKQVDEEEVESEAPAYADEAGDEDQALKSCRPARPDDQLLTEQEIVALYANEETGSPLALKSAYGSSYGQLCQSHGVECFKQRPPDEGIDSSVFDGETGADEPIWTSHTPIWRCTLDYIFSLEGEGAKGQKLQTTGLLPLHKTLECEPGLPRAEICGSDHMALMTEYAFDEA